MKSISTADVLVVLLRLMLGCWLGRVRLLHDCFRLFAISTFTVIICLAIVLNQVAAFLYYDHLITIGDEILYIWRPRKTASSYLFFLNRYFTFFGNIAMMVYAWYPLNPEVRNDANHPDFTFFLLYFHRGLNIPCSSFSESWLILYSPQLQALQHISANVPPNWSDPRLQWAIHRNRRVSLIQCAWYQFFLLCEYTLCMAVIAAYPFPCLLLEWSFWEWFAYISCPDNISCPVLISLRNSGRYLVRNIFPYQR